MTKPILFRISGTNGSGKTTVVKTVRAQYETVTLFRGDTPEKPDQILGYECTSTTLRPLLILGPYERPTGGLDSWNWAGAFEWVYAYMRLRMDEGWNILCEGLAHSADRSWIGGLVDDGYDARVLALSTTLEDCLIGTNARRRERGQEELFDTHRIEAKYRAVAYSYPFWDKYKVPWKSLSREEMPKHIIDELWVF